MDWLVWNFLVEQREFSSSDPLRVEAVDLHAAATRFVAEKIRHGELCRFTAADLDRACAELVNRGSITLSIDAATGGRSWTFYDLRRLRDHVLRIRKEWARYGASPPEFDPALMELD